MLLLLLSSSSSPLSFFFFFPPSSSSFHQARESSSQRLLSPTQRLSDISGGRMAKARCGSGDGSNGASYQCRGATKLDAAKILLS